MRPEPRITPEAQGDVLEAAVYYNSQRSLLGDSFIEEVERAISQIRETPMLFPVVDDPIRRILVRRFPYGVFAW